MLCLKPRILCIDDEPAVGELLRTYFEATGDFCLEHESDPLSALAHAQAYQPDVVILDISMPGRDGHTLAREMRQEPGLRDRPIIFFSGLPDAEEPSLDAGGDGPTTFVKKGTPLKVMEQAVRHFTAEGLQRFRAAKATVERSNPSHAAMAGFLALAARALGSGVVRLGELGLALAWWCRIAGSAAWRWREDAAFQKARNGANRQPSE